MKMRELFLILLLAAAITYVTRPYVTGATKGNFASKHPKIAKVMNGGARLAKWAGIYFLFADDLATPDKSGEYDPEHSPPYSKDEERLYGDEDYQHFAAANAPPVRAAGKDGFPVINHGNGW